MSEAARSIPVCFADPKTAAIDVSHGDLIFRDVVEAEVTSRSRILSCIAEAGGDARLPEAVSVPDFRRWIEACRTDERERRYISFEALCTVLKVADVLDDKGLDQWVALAVDHLATACQAQDPTHTPPATTGAPNSDRKRKRTSTAEAAHQLSLLPATVQHKVLAAAANRAGIHALLDTLPASLHATALTAIISTPDATLQLHAHHNPRPFLDALAALPASPSSLSSLHAFCKSWAPEAQHDLAAHLAQALLHHSTLSSLRLTLPQHSVEAVQLLAPAIATLTALQSLHLGGRRSPLCSDLMPHLKAAIHRLPRLTYLTAYLEVSAEPQPVAPCATVAAAAPATPATPPAHESLMEAVAAATALTSLHLHLKPRSLVVDGEAAVRGCDAVTLPHLRHLELGLPRCSWATPLFTRLNAPLTSLVLSHSQGDARRAADTTAEREQCARCLSRFLDLQSLSVAPSYDAWAMSALCTALSQPQVPLRGVRRLRLTAHFTKVFKAAPLLATGMPALECLAASVTTNSSNFMATVPQDGAWDGLAGHLSHLQRLDLAFKGRGGATGPSIAALRRLTGLSALRLHALASPADLVPAIAELTQLQQLSLTTFQLPDGSAATFVPSLRALRRLTALVLSGRGVPEAVMHASAAGQLDGAWPALRVLGLQLGRAQPEEAVEAVARAVCALPALQRLVLTLDGGMEELQRGQGPDAVPPSRLPEGVQRVAAAAGVTATLAPYDPTLPCMWPDDVFQ